MENMVTKKEIPTPMGEALNWDYWMYSKENPTDEWMFESYILYPSEDRLTSRKTVDNFVNRNKIKLTVLEGAEHYFTETKHLEQLQLWMEINI